MLLLPMFRHSGVCLHAGLVQAFQLFERQLEVVPDQSSHVPLSRRKEADRAFVSVEQFEARSADHVTMTGDAEQLFDQVRGKLSHNMVQAPQGGVRRSGQHQVFRPGRSANLLRAAVRAVSNAALASYSYTPIWLSHSQITDLWGAGVGPIC